MENKVLISPSAVAKYFLVKAREDGELISPLKMQKLVYYAYAWFLVKKNERLFKEGIQAWPNGPVIPSLYQELKKYGSNPINSEEFTGIDSQVNSDKFIATIPEEILSVLDEVYSKYMVFTPFELVMLTHSEKPWNEARKGLLASQHTTKVIGDKDILEQYKTV